MEWRLLAPLLSSNANYIYVKQQVETWNMTTIFYQLLFRHYFIRHLLPPEIFAERFKKQGSLRLMQVLPAKLKRNQLSSLRGYRCGSS